MASSTTRGSTPTDHCVICFDALPSRAAGAQATPCGHDEYHSHCLLQWLELNPSCPLCKAQVESVRYGPGKSSVYTPPAKASSSRSTQTGGSAVFAQDTYGTRRGRIRVRGRCGRRRTPRSNSPNPRAFPSYRLDVYGEGRYSLHIGSNRYSAYRNISSLALSHDPELLSRARAFIRRDLLVLEALSAQHQNQQDQHQQQRQRHRAQPAQPHRPRSDDYGGPPRDEYRTQRQRAVKLEYIVEVLKTVDMQAASGAAEGLVARFLGEHTLVFLHELRSWLRSPYKRLAEWDRMVRYGPPTRGVAPRVPLA